jgi:hypothetical protein
MMKQSDAVVAAVTTVMGQQESYDWSEVKPHLNEIMAILTEGFMSGNIQLSDENKRNPEWLRKYVPGLVNNHVRKDKRLNGGTEYIAKNPGSRQGAGDAQLKALRSLLASGAVTSPEDIAEIEAAISKRQDELKPQVTVDYSALPEALRAKYSR